MHDGVGSNPANGKSNVTYRITDVLDYYETPLTNGEGNHREESWVYYF